MAEPVKAHSHSSSGVFEIVIIFILVIVLIILITLVVHYARRRSICFNYPSPWCYSDWECPNAPPNERNVWDNLKNKGLAAVPATEGACYAGPSDGVNPSQKNCPNAWTFLNKQTQIVNTTGNADGNTLLVYTGLTPN